MHFLKIFPKMPSRQIWNKKYLTTPLKTNKKSLFTEHKFRNSPTKNNIIMVFFKSTVKLLRTFYHIKIDDFKFVTTTKFYFWRYVTFILMLPQVLDLFLIIRATARKISIKQTCNIFCDCLMRPFSKNKNSKSCNVFDSPWTNELRSVIFCKLSISSLSIKIKHNSFFHGVALYFKTQFLNSFIAESKSFLKQSRKWIKISWKNSSLFTKICEN